MLKRTNKTNKTFWEGKWERRQQSDVRMTWLSIKSGSVCACQSKPHLFLPFPSVLSLNWSGGEMRCDWSDRRKIVRRRLFRIIKHSKCHPRVDRWWTFSEGKRREEAPSYLPTAAGLFDAPCSTPGYRPHNFIFSPLQSLRAVGLFRCRWSRVGVCWVTLTCTGVSYRITPTFIPWPAQSLIFLLHNWWFQSKQKIDYSVSNLPLDWFLQGKKNWQQRQQRAKRQ